MCSMPLEPGLGSDVGVISRFGDATARDTAAPAAVAAVPTSSWRRVSGDMASALRAQRGDRGGARGEDIGSERRDPRRGGVPEVAVAVGAAGADAEQVLDGAQQRVVVVRR